MNKAVLVAGQNSTVKSISNFAIEKASDFGFAEEMKVLKSIGDNPDKIFEAVSGAAVGVISDPEIVKRELINMKTTMVINLLKSI